MTDIIDLEKKINSELTTKIKESNISDPVELGSRLFMRNCVTCHNVDTKTKIGPGLANVFGTTREFSNSDAVMADEDYIRESIIAPNAKIVNGFPGKMNSFAGLLSEKEINYLIEYIKTLKQ